MFRQSPGGRTPHLNFLKGNIPNEEDVILHTCLKLLNVVVNVSLLHLHLQVADLLELCHLVGVGKQGWGDVRLLSGRFSFIQSCQELVEVRQVAIPIWGFCATQFFIICFLFKVACPTIYTSQYIFTIVNIEITFKNN